MSWNDKAIKQDSLPFPPTPSASIAGRTMRESDGYLAPSPFAFSTTRRLRSSCIVSLTW
jgi:hypothetical protein